VRWSRILAGILGGALAAAVWFGGPIAFDRVAELESLEIREIEVTGGERVPAEEILELSGLREGESWLAIDRDAVGRRIRSSPWVESVAVRRPWPGRVRLEVRECRALARVIVEGSSYGVASDLRILPGLAPADLDALPLIRGDRRGGLDPAALARGVRWVETLLRCRLARDEPVEVELGREDLESGTDRIRFPDRDFTVQIENAVSPESAVRNVAAFLEKLDASGASRGTLRLMSEGTAVWTAAAST
jgi:hypothetical protein